MTEVPGTNYDRRIPTDYYTSTTETTSTQIATDGLYSVVSTTAGDLVDFSNGARRAKDGKIDDGMAAPATTDTTDTTTDTNTGVDAGTIGGVINSAVCHKIPDLSFK